MMFNINGQTLDLTSEKMEEIAKAHRLEKCAETIRFGYGTELSEEELNFVSSKMYEAVADAEFKKGFDFVMHEIDDVIKEAKGVRV